MPSFFKSRTLKKVKPKMQKNQDFKDYGKLKVPLSPKLTEQLQFIREQTGNSADVIIRKTSIDEKLGIQTALVYIDGLTDSQTINEFLIDAILQNRQLHEKLSTKPAIATVMEEVMALGEAEVVSDWASLFQALMSGNTIICIDGVTQALSADTRGGEQRSIEEPNSEVAVRGPRDGFTENIGTNLSLVRRRIQNPNLWVEMMKIGNVTKTDVAMVYVKGIAKEKIVNEVRERLNRIEVDSLLESGYIEQLIEDQPFTPFPTIYHTERPDVVAGNLLEGRIAIIVNGTPFVLLAPAVFIQFFQAVEDYYSRADIATALRFLRVVIFLLSMIAPAVYIAGTTFHQEMIPTQLLIAVAAQRETVPFPAFVEALIMEGTFEILREAGVRMPRAVGSAISIVGALVIGQAAIQAGIVSPAMVIVVSITAIANFATPAYAIAISSRLIRFAFMVGAAFIGFYGVILGVVVLVIHLTSLRSFGVPYLTPFAPTQIVGLGDSVVRLPLWMQKDRSKLIAEKPEQIGKNQRPGPEEKRVMINYKAKGERK